MKNKILVLAAILIVFAGCSAPVASPQEEVRTVVDTQSIIPINAKTNTWLISQISMDDGTSQVDYIFAKKNPDGSTMRMFVGKILVPYSTDPNSTRSTPSFIRVFEDSNGDDARIDSVSCYVKDKYCRDGSVGVNIHIPPGGLNSDSLNNPPEDSKK